MIDANTPTALCGIPRHAHALAHHRRQRLVLPGCRSDNEIRPPRSVRHPCGEQIDGQFEMREAVPHLSRRLPRRRPSAPARVPPSRPMARHAIRFLATRSCRRAGPSAADDAAARCPRRPPARNARHAAAVVAASAPCAAARAAMPARRPAQCAIQGHSTQAGAAGVQIVAPRSNSAWAKSDGCAVASGSAPSSRGKPTQHRLGCRQAAPPRRTAAPPRARRCHRPAPSAGRTRSPQPPPRCSRRCPAEPAGRPDHAGNRPPRPPPARRRAGCARGRSSLAQPRQASTASSGAAASASTLGKRLKKAS